MDDRMRRLASTALEDGRDLGQSHIGLISDRAMCEHAKSISLADQWLDAGMGINGHALSRNGVAQRLGIALEEGEYVRALTLTNAWGFGKTGYGWSRHRRILADERLEASLRGTAERVIDGDPVGAYFGLNNASADHVRFLGPAFFTKFMYFVALSRDPGFTASPRPKPLILDALVASSMRRLVGDLFRRTSGWRTPVYAFYIGFAEGAAGRQRADLVEAELFARARADDQRRS